MFIFGGGVPYNQEVVEKSNPFLRVGRPKRHFRGSVAQDSFHEVDIEVTSLLAPVTGWVIVPIRNR